MLRNALARMFRWMRRHPVRCVVYALLVVGAVWAGLTARGILLGRENALLTSVARAPLLRGWVDREFHIRYSIDAVALAPKCGYQIDVRGVSVELVGAASGGLDEATVCVSGSGELHGIRVGDKLISVQAVEFDWPKSVSGSGISWSDRDGEMVSAGAFTASPNDVSGSLQNLRVLSIASIDSASAALAPLAPPAIDVKNAAARGIKVDIDTATIAQAPARLQAAANALQAMGTATLPLPAQWLATARKLVVQLLIGAAILLLVLKVLLTRAPASIVWRVAAMLAPFAAFPLLALANSWLVIVIAAPVIAIALWAAAYRRAAEWQQRWEPAAIDVPAVLLGLLLLVLWNWPAIATPQIPAIKRVTVAQADVQDVAATVHQLACGVSNVVRVAVPQAAVTGLRVDLDSATAVRVAVPQAGVTGLRADVAGAAAVHVAVPQAGVANLSLALDGPALKSIDMDRASASGSVQTAALDALRSIRYLPPAWTKTPPVGFCAAVTLRNSGPADLPAAACPAGTKLPAVIARAAVDYTGQQARFAADWNGSPAPVAAAGSANLAGAQVDLHTKPGASVHIAKASASVAWPKAIAANVLVEGVEASGATVDRMTLNASAPAPCTVGPINVAGDLGKTRYSFGGNDIQLDSAAFAFARPDSRKISATVHSGRFSLGGPVEASIPASAFEFEGTTSPESIPQTLTAQAGFTTAAVGLLAPIRFTANLWSGDWQLPEQSMTVLQQITSRIPPAIVLQLQASGGIVSLASPLQANARAQLRIPQLVPDLGPTDIELNDLRVEGAWDAATGLAPANISTGWNIVKLPAFPSGFQFNEVSALELTTRGRMVEAPAFVVPQMQIPSVPQETRFRLQGTPQSITVAIDGGKAGGEQLTLDNISTSNIKASLPNLKLASVDLDTSAQVKRAHAAFPFSGHTRLTDTSIGTVLTQPLGAELALAPQALHFALTRPLDTGKLLDEVGFSLDGIQPQATLADLQANVTFAGKKLAGLDVAGTLAAGPLATVNNLAVTEQAPATFHVAAPELPGVTVSASAPAVEVTIDGGKLRASAAASVSLKFTLADAPQSPLFTQFADAAAGLSAHVQKATQVFGPDGFSAESFSAFPLDWDLAVTGGSPTISLTPGNIAINAKTLLHRVDIGQETIDGSVDLHAGARLAEGHLLLDVNAPADIGALGRRWQLNTPLFVALRKDLLPGTGGELFDSAFYSRIGGPAQPGAGPFRLAIGYGDALQIHSAYQQPFTSGTIGGLAQAAIRWQNGAASIDSFGTFTFRGLEAGTLAFPNAYLEDRLDGDVRFSTKGFLADRLLAPQLLADASRVRQLDLVDFSAQVRSAADGAHLPGILQTSSGISLKPADPLVQLLTSGLSLRFPTQPLQYQNMALDFRVQQGRVQTEPVLLSLSGIQVFSFAGAAVDSNVRILWGRHGQEPAPLLRDLIYTLQRSIEP